MGVVRNSWKWKFVAGSKGDKPVGSYKQEVHQSFTSYL
ncbi:hypothetical protein FLA_0705 [Filimonas lacunae]|nr:hypothetical protein FLA_0705 [Filimonas lacunae]